MTDHRMPAVTVPYVVLTDKASATPSAAGQDALPDDLLLMSLKGVAAHMERAGFQVSANAVRQGIAALTRTPSPSEGVREADAPVLFYEREFYPLSNFSAFRLRWREREFDTSEAAYHFEKFPTVGALRMAIYNAPSAHEAFKIAERNRSERRPDWDAVKVDIMREILRAKADQHEYVRRKLLETGDRPLIEDSWRDDFWGWGPNRDGQNMLGKLWMEVRAALASSTVEETLGGEG